MPRTKEQNQKILDARKQDIINCAISLLAYNNYNEVSIDEIASKLKMSHGLFYHYFKNKIDLISTILVYAEKNVLASLGEDLINLEGEELLYTFFDRFITTCKNKETSNLIKLIINLVKSNYNHNKLKLGLENLQKFYNSILEKSVHLLSAEEKLLHPVEISTKLISLMINGIILLATENRIKDSPLKAEHLVKSIIK